jgi:hypothetical protein
VEEILEEGTQEVNFLTWPFRDRIEVKIRIQG